MNHFVSLTQMDSLASFVWIGERITVTYYLRRMNFQIFEKLVNAIRIMGESISRGVSSIHQCAPSHTREFLFSNSKTYALFGSSRVDVWKTDTHMLRLCVCVA